jgi:hypothetical protein
LGYHPSPIGHNAGREGNGENKLPLNRPTYSTARPTLFEFIGWRTVVHFILLISIIKNDKVHISIRQLIGLKIGWAVILY